MPSDSLRKFDTTDTIVEVGSHAFTLTHPRSSDELLDEAAFAHDDRLPYWADIWPSSRVLAEVLVRHQGDARSALELGCGSGLVACALASAGYRVTATDYYVAALSTTAANVVKNVGVTIATRMVDWRDLPDDLGTFDLVVAADVLYETRYAELVAHTIARTLGAEGSAIIADPGRVAFDPFLALLPALGLYVDEGWEVPHARDGQSHVVRLRVIKRLPRGGPGPTGP